MGRFSLASSLWFVAFVAFGFAAVRNASDFWVGATFLATLGLLCASVLGAVLERGRGGAWWLGFALFGWPYLVAPLVPALAEAARLPSSDLARRIFAASNLMPGGPPMGGLGMGGSMLQIGLDGRPVSPPRPGAGPGGLHWQEYGRRHQTNAVLIGHWLFVLIFARAGATVSCVFTKGLPWRKKPAGDPAPIAPPVP